MGFTEELVTYLRDESSIADIEVYADTAPSPKTLSPSIVGVFPSADSHSVTNRSQSTLSRRFVVSGSAAKAKAKAEEIYNYFIKSNQQPVFSQDTSFSTTNYIVFGVFAESEPALISNTGNIFLANFVLRFVVTR